MNTIWNREAVLALYRQLPSGHCDLHTLRRVLRDGAKQGGDVVTLDDDYSYAAGIDFGRRYASHTYQTLSGRSRATLAGTLYHDIDIVACHPTMLLHAFKTATIESPELEAYITDREATIADIIANHTTLDRATVKKGYNVATYLGCYKKHATGRRSHIQQLERFTRELRSNAKLLAGRPEHADLLALAKRHKEDGKSHLGTFLSYVCQQLEARARSR